MGSNSDPRYRRTRYGAVYVGFDPRRRGRVKCQQERPESWGWQPAYRHPELKRMVYEQQGCKLARSSCGWYAENRYGVSYHYQASLGQLTADLLADEQRPGES